MLKKWKQRWNKMVYPVLNFLTTYLGKGLVRMLLLTCRWQVEGLERFKQTASNEKMHLDALA